MRERECGELERQTDRQNERKRDGGRDRNKMNERKSAKNRKDRE